MENRLLPFMKHLGSGKHGARSMSQQDARVAMEAVLAGDYHPVTLGAFLQSLRFKGETAEEIAGFAEAVAAGKSTPPGEWSLPPGTLDCAGAYDGKVRTLNVSIPAALVAAAAGVPMVLHGGRGIPTKEGLTVSHILEALGIQTRGTVSEAVERLHRVHFAYLHQPDFHPALHATLEDRRQVGKRTILNTVEPLANPLRASAHLGGFFHDAYGELVAAACARTSLGFDRVLLVKGIEGSDELRPGVMMIWEIREGCVSTMRVDSEALGLPMQISDLGCPVSDLTAGACTHAQRIEEVVEGGGNRGYRSSVVLNAAIRLYTGGLCKSLPEGVAISAEILSSGRAAERLELLRTGGRSSAKAA